MYIENLHNRAWCQQDNLLPYCTTFLLTDGVDFVKNDAIGRRVSSIVQDLSKCTYRLILGVQCRESCGDSSMMANISGTVTRI